MTDLDLTKPLRLKDTKERFYPASGLDTGSFIRGLRDDSAITGDEKGRFHAHVSFLTELENIPEPLARYIRVKLDIDSCCGASAWFGSLHHSLPPEDNDPVLRGTTLLKLTRTEDGKTHVEVVDG